jgi:hypothetical protein
MKNIKYIILILTVFFFSACEEVVDVDLNTAPPRLVIDASIDWVKGTDGSLQTIKLTQTTDYYQETVPTVSGATVFITNSANTVFDFIEIPDTGEYVCTNFVPVIGESYTLTVQHDGQTYNATETLYAVPEISNVVQDNEGGFLNEDIEVRFFFMDNGLEDNFYLVRFDADDVLPYPDYDALKDEFFQGNEMFDFIDNEDFKPGHVVGLRLYGVSERYYNYMMILISMVEGGAGSGPFQTPPVNARGNIVNFADENNFALGYFRLGEVSSVDYTIQ